MSLLKRGRELSGHQRGFSMALDSRKVGRVIPVPVVRYLSIAGACGLGAIAEGQAWIHVEHER